MTYVREIVHKPENNVGTLTRGRKAGTGNGEQGTGNLGTLTRQGVKSGNREPAIGGQAWKPDGTLQLRCVPLPLPLSSASAAAKPTNGVDGAPRIPGPPYGEGDWDWGPGLVW
jgi:hypothetical protein